MRWASLAMCENSLPYKISNEFTCLQISSGSHVKWTVSEHMALHKLFGAYRRYHS